MAWKGTTRDFISGGHWCLVFVLPSPVLKPIVKAFITRMDLYRQVDLNTALAVGLVGHEKLVGRSSIGDGKTKYDYLAQVTLGILDILLINLKSYPTLHVIHPLLTFLPPMFLYLVHLLYQISPLFDFK